MSIGGDRVRVKFNPSANGTVDRIKCTTAELIDICKREQDELYASASPQQQMEVGRLWSLAMTAYEEAAMWAVKAATA